jgi:hypothetical protein
MRTTIQLADESRETLLSIAQARGERGVSRVVEEAVSFYLAERDRPALPVVVEAKASPAGPFQRLGEKLDREVGPQPSLLAMVRALVRGGLRLLPLSRA